jgi:hypothetical protein
MGMQTWTDRDITDADITQAVRDTEAEIWAEALGQEEPDDQSDQFIEDMSQAEGWDGNDLPIEEIANRNLHGDTQTGYDRPLELQDSLDLQRENDALRARDAEREAEWQQYIMQPEVERQRAEQREQVRQHLMEKYGMIDSFDDAKTDQFIADMNAPAQAARMLNDQRVEASMTHWHNTHGRDFEAAYDELTSRDPNDPYARQDVQRIVSSPDPGQALMMWHSAIQGAQQWAPPPFMPQSRRAAPRRSGYSEMGGWGDGDVESEVFHSVWD